MKYAFGGSLFNHKRKSKRPLVFDKSTHMTLRLRALLPPLFDPYDHKLRQIIFRIAQKNNIRIYDLVFNHNHMHAALLLPDRQEYVRFIREMTAQITQYFSKNLEFLGVRLKRIFIHRPFTRSVPWGKPFEQLKKYMFKNEMESGVRQLNWNNEIHSHLGNTFGLVGSPSGLMGSSSGLFGTTSSLFRSPISSNPLQLEFSDLS